MQDLGRLAAIIIGLAGGIACAIIGAVNGLDILRDFGIALANLIIGAVLDRNYAAIARRVKCWIKRG